MNEAVTRVVGAAAIDALPFSLAPRGRRANFIDCAHESKLMGWVFCDQAGTVSAGPIELKGGLSAMARRREIELIRR